MIILGINCVYHESSAALLLDGKLSFFVEEERINRIKHGKPSKVNNPHLLPMNAISECLKFANITLDDVDFIGFSFDNGGRLQNIGVDTCTEPGEWGTKEGEETFHSLLVQIPAILQGLGKKPLGKRFKWVPHHISHSAGAFLCSPFENALIFAIDGIGEFDSLMMCEGSVNSIKPFYTLPYPHSLGFLWEKISKFLGFSEYDCCKVMGLSSYGDPSRFKNEFQKLAFWVEESGFFVDLEFAQFRCSQFGNLEKLFGPCRRENEKIEERHSDIAAALQNFTQEAVIRLCRLGKKRANSKTLCLAGGVALNCVMNGFLERSEEFNQIYVQPSANDAGTALGAALYIWNIEQSRERNFVLDHTYWGPEYSTKEIESVLVQRGFRYKCLDDPSKTAAELVAQGNIVGWFQGRMEMGPRALGNRSLLADPRRPDMREILNSKIKHREPFRPFAPSVLYEKTSEWFEFPGISDSSDFMLFAYPAKPAKREVIPAVVHIDGTSRIQTVRASKNPMYHRLIREFDRLTGVPMVLNTSFNDSEPIVMSPNDALNTFQKTGIDYVILEKFLVEKKFT